MLIIYRQCFINNPPQKLKKKKITETRKDTSTVMEWIFKANIFIWMYGRGGTCKSVWCLLTVANPSQWRLKNKRSLFSYMDFFPLIRAWTPSMVSMFVLRFYLFDQIKETVSAHLSRLRTWRCQEQEKWKVWVVVGEEPNFRISSEFIYVEETKQLMQKEGQGTFFLTLVKYLYQIDSCSKYGVVRRWSIQKW